MFVFVYTALHTCLSDRLVCPIVILLAVLQSLPWGIIDVCFPISCFLSHYTPVEVHMVPSLLVIMLIYASGSQSWSSGLPALHVLDVSLLKHT